LTNPTNGYTPIQIQKSTKKQNKETNQRRGRRNRENKKGQDKHLEEKEPEDYMDLQGGAGCYNPVDPSPNSHPDPSPPPLLHLLLLLLFVQLRLLLLLLLLLPLHRNTILHFRNPANRYYYFFLRYKFKISPKKSKKKSEERQEKNREKKAETQSCRGGERKERNLMWKCDLPDASPP